MRLERHRSPNTKLALLIGSGRVGSNGVESDGMGNTLLGTHERRRSASARPLDPSWTNASKHNESNGVIRRVGGTQCVEDFTIESCGVCIDFRVEEEALIVVITSVKVVWH